ncbi:MULTISPECIES: glycosyltransferase family 2 protein [Lactobacillus]|uniref:Glycosyltransferase family 2 protein n=1 Tax=Lactobacillus mulieris TaxID=2508708 RepID=A0AAW5WZK7_9LACO|nr:MULTISPECIES: glycosyltransferase family 2 protein [Lactobacillus]MCZ3622902.1 glycosyltransferase family 2 protein [Lactobacillus mulieris]MCZ3624584.1 glycosyltransferase family 2 protein [Lactobacillus mulieris]MCZ3636906.1 glycosyltransferase family 2 protein [Lactobacillus mulieris]MCZ3645626.1 glycosyltransferase family 2 protein [Lactobacillus crispatus]MCZ3690805.1 glycosyltransferase family 2 protein [Lactobacillus mulieris]
MKGNILSIIVPCYNEELVLLDSAYQLGNLLKKLIKDKKVSEKSKIIFVNDGSIDKTWNIINDLQHRETIFSGISLSRNFGHQNAVMAGLSRAIKYSDMMITIDADLQDDINKIYEMVDYYLRNYDIVFGVRNNRKTDTKFKRWTAEGYYWLMTKLGVNLIPDHADFRLMSKEAVQALLLYKEENLFLRGIVAQLGFKSAKVFYKRKERKAGKSHYPLKKMLELAINGLISFSELPLKVIGLCGILMLIFGLGKQVIFKGNTISDLADLFCIFTGIQLLALSIIAIYLGKIFENVKNRPRYIIEQDTYSKSMAADKRQ